MITTRQISLKLSKGKKELSRVTTRDVDANIRFKVPTGKPAKKPIVSTNKLADVADIITKKKRDDIMAERKAIEETKAKKKPEKVKKAWKEMTNKEKKVAYKERAMKAKATREAKAKKKEEKK